MAALPSDYKGITLEFKRSTVYKDLYKAVKELNPGLPDYLVDIAIHTHVTNPRAYRECAKRNQDARPSHPKGEQVTTAVRVLDEGAEELRTHGFVPGTEPWVAHPGLVEGPVEDPPQC